MKTLKVLYLVGVVFCSLFWTVGAMAGERVLIVKIIELQSEPNSEIVFDKLTFSTGLPPVQRLTKDSQNAPYEFQVLDSKGKVIYTQEFDFTRYIEVPLPESGSEQQVEASRIPLKKPEAVLVIPYLPEGVEIRVKGADETTSPAPVPPVPVSYQPADPAQEGNLYILLIASGFSGDSEMISFQSNAQGIKDYLVSKEPFASRSSNIIISIYENTDDLGCYNGCEGIDRLTCCNSENVMASAVASGHLYDEIIVIHNTATYSGGGYRDHGFYKANSASTYCIVYNGSAINPMSLHEFGHSFGNLCDEYTYDDEGFSYYDCANCRAKCSAWRSVSKGCQLSCDARSDYYRPEDSIMLTLGIDYYNQPSIHNGLIPRLNYFIPDVCAAEEGAAYGLCNAYCEAMDCDSDTFKASDKACIKIYDKFVEYTGQEPPCEANSTY